MFVILPLLSSIQTPSLCYIVICGLSGPTVFFKHYFIKDKILGKSIL